MDINRMMNQKHDVSKLKVKATCNAHTRSARVIVKMLQKLQR